MIAASGLQSQIPTCPSRYLSYLTYRTLLIVPYLSYIPPDFHSCWSGGQSFRLQVLKVSKNGALVANATGGGW